MKTLPAAAGAVLLGAAALFAVPTPIPPAPERWVTDQAGFLSEPARRALDARLDAYERATGHQVLVWIGRTTGGTPVEDFAVRAFQAWAVGRKGMDDGLVLFVFPDDRTLRFEVGYGLEGVLPDVVAFRIIREVIAPRLQAGDRDGAIAAGIDAALAAIGGAGGEGVAHPEPAREPVPAQGRPLSAAEKIVIAVLALGFLALLITNPALAMWLLVNIASGAARGGRGGGWGGGGFSGGGGRSGGGGASGSW